MAVLQAFTLVDFAQALLTNAAVSVFLSTTQLFASLQARARTILVICRLFHVHRNDAISMLPTVDERVGIYYNLHVCIHV